MTFNEYQDLVVKMPLYDNILYGLVGEVGEVAEIIKKDERPQDSGFRKPLDKEKLLLELGDVLWYLSRLGAKYGITLQDIADQNIVKLNGRHGL
jgi:NTP pyrophosphatase (non-canonical NTP hydrolase)